MGGAGAALGEEVELEGQEQEMVVQRVAKDCTARVTFTGRVTQEAINKLCAILDLMKDTYPTQSDPV